MAHIAQEQHPSVTGYMTETFTQNGTVADVNIADPQFAINTTGHMIKFVNPKKGQNTFGQK